jgi:DGQHR domain-containing protein
MRKENTRVIRCAALRVDQDPKHPLFLFTLTGTQLLGLADISRVERDGQGKLSGYQRSEVKQHVRNIVEYLDNGQVLFPNSIILAFSKLRFTPMDGISPQQNATAGVLEVSLPREGERKPAWIVDGQQRAMAISKSQNKELAVPVNAFLAPEVEFQIDQFLRINSAKPLPRGLITELLPSVSTRLPAKLAARQAPSAICDLLNQDAASPFRGLIRRSSTPKALQKEAVIADTALVQMIQDSISSPLGCLFPYYRLATRELDGDGARSVLLTYWNAVKETFPDAWGLAPTKSRLMHGTGLRAMGRLMDRIMGGLDVSDHRTSKVVRQELARLRPLCRWTSGEWDAPVGLRWNEVQNVPSHLRALSNYLVRSYLGDRKALA